MAPDFHFCKPRIGYSLQHDPFNAIVDQHPMARRLPAAARAPANLVPCSFFTKVPEQLFRMRRPG